MDTGASINIIPEHMAGQLDTQKGAAKEIKIVGDTATISGKEEATIEFNGEIAEADFSIMRNSKEILMGLPTIKNWEF